MRLDLVASFDPGLNFGLSVVERERQSYRVRFAKAVQTAPDLSKGERLQVVFKEIEYAMRSTGSRHLAIEEQEGAQVQRSKEGGSSLTDARVNNTVGVALGVCYAYGYTWSFYQPKQAKIAMLGKGSGMALKTSVKEACRRLLKFDRGCQLVLHSADSIAGAVYTLQHAL